MTPLPVRVRARFQTKFFLAALSAAIIALAVAGVLFATTMRRQIDARIEATLIAEARMAADLLGRGVPLSSVPELRGRSRSGSARLIGARVTFIAADGRVVGDSGGNAGRHRHRREPRASGRRSSTRGSVGIGRSRRYSTTVKFDMLYVAVPVSHPAIAFVRVALPLTDVRDQLQTVLTATLTALGVALLGGAAIAWLFSARIGKRVRLIAGIADRYRRGDLTPPHLGFGDDELGTVARALDESVQEVGRRLGEQARDRARMEAILAGMVEGVIVVDPQGRLQLVNDAARQMLKLDAGDSRHRTPLHRDHPACRRSRSWWPALCSGRAPDAVELSPPRDPSRTIIASAAAGGRRRARTASSSSCTTSPSCGEADQIRRDFVANVSHELRTPLTAIRGYVEALSDGDADEDERARFLEIIARHTQRMERLVKDLLRLARLDAGQETLELDRLRHAQPRGLRRRRCGARRGGTRPANRGVDRGGRRNRARRSGANCTTRCAIS